MEDTCPKGGDANPLSRNDFHWWLQASVAAGCSKMGLAGPAIEQSGSLESGGGGQSG
jgi:hypothetical protein